MYELPSILCLTDLHTAIFRMDMGSDFRDLILPMKVPIYKIHVHCYRVAVQECNLNYHMMNI